MLDAVEIYGFKTVREARKVLVWELEKVIQALGGRGEAMDKDEVKESSCRGYSNGECPSVARVDASELPEAQPPNHKS